MTWSGNPSDYVLDAPLKTTLFGEIYEKKLFDYQIIE